MTKSTRYNKTQPDNDGFKLGNELVGLFSIFIGLLFILSLATFDFRDPWLNHVVSGTAIIHNKAGLFGSYTGGLLFDLCGYAAWLVPGFFCFIGARRILGAELWPWWRWTGGGILFIVLSFVGASRDVALDGSAQIITNHGGGILGHAVYTGLINWLSPTGAWLIWTLCLLLSVQVLIGFSWLPLVANCARILMQTSTRMAGDFIKEQHKKQKTPIALESDAADPSHFSLPPALFGRATAGVPHDASAEQNDGTDEFAFSDAEQESEQGRARKFLGSLFSPSSKDTGNISLDMPPWVDDFEQGNIGTQPANGSLRPDFEQVAEAEKQDASQPHNEDALINIIESYENSLSTINSGGHASHELPEPSPEALHTQDMPAGQSGGAQPEPGRQQQTAPVNHTEQASCDTEKVAPIPIRDKAPDSVIGEPVQTEDQTPVRKKARLPLPSLDLLEKTAQPGSQTPYNILEAKAKDLMTCLTDFGIQGELVGITPGPVVTMFEVRPAPGVRVARIANLSDDLALALKAVAVRIQAPVPGTDTVGIEIPNEDREVVCLREILASEKFNRSKSLLSIALGKDIAGHPTVADLATMPHLLVAGATGAGKSVGINSIILSLLYKATPDEVRLLLVDPKRVEMAIYADLPHLVHPVVTEMQLAKNALEWAVREMDDRYVILAKAQVRNITDYNAKLKEHSRKRIPEMEGLEAMPYLVIIIDELADLMLTAAKEVETSIVRLAQLARAAGIHLILATQRPSVDVVTGIIKANFPCRIAFQVTSKHDSRTILDSVGAEHLLGKGDMLFKPSGGRFQRMHGAFVNDKNVKRVVDYWKSMQKPAFDIDFAEIGSASGDGPTGGSSEIYDDPLYNDAVDFVCQQGKASISLIQRRFRICFNKAARMIEQMEEDGIVGPQEGSKPRTVLR